MMARRLLLEVPKIIRGLVAITRAKLASSDPAIGRNTGRKEIWAVAESVDIMVQLHRIVCIYVIDRVHGSVLN